jgi:hypothetical protein
MAMQMTRPVHRELAHRVGDGMEITLYWSVGDDTVHLEVRQPATDEKLWFRVARERALDAFYHPFAHVPLAEAWRAGSVARP